MKNIAARHEAQDAAHDGRRDGTPGGGRGRNSAGVKRALLDTCRKFSGMFYALRQLAALQQGMGALQQGIAGLQRDVQALQRNVATLSPVLKDLQTRAGGLASGQAFLASPLLAGPTAAKLAARSYRARAEFLKELFVKNWDFLLHTWTVGEGSEKCLDIDGVRMTANFPDKNAAGAIDIFLRSFFIYLFFDDDYARDIVIPVEQVIRHVRQYVDDTIDVRIKPGDTVIDAGAWIGDFSAYAARKGATVHAFEPTRRTFELLCETAALNEGRILPVMKGLGAENGAAEFGLYLDSQGENRLLRAGVNFRAGRDREVATIELATLDSYVEEAGLSRVDFLKADIEGAEDFLLAGATNTLRKFAPRLSIATYHGHNNVEQLQKAILDANPGYRLVQCRTVLFGAGRPVAG